jgi:predicted DsbA family dithiol-disulfide isomerase
LDVPGLSDVIREGRYRKRVFAEHQTAVDIAIRGVPAVVLPRQTPIVGAVPYEDLRRAAERALGATAKTP